MSSVKNRIILLMKSIIKRFIIIRMNMKYDRIKRKIKRHCRFDDSTIFFETASVINRFHDKSRIILGGALILGKTYRYWVMKAGLR